MTFKEQFKKSFSYTWYLYLLAIVLPAILFPLSYSFMHRSREYQTLSLFLSGDVFNNEIENDLEERFHDFGVKTAEVVSINPYENEYLFYQKLSVVGYSRCDILILPEDKISIVQINTAAIEINADIKNICEINEEPLYLIEEVPYGIKIPSLSPICDYAYLKNDVDYYAFINASSWNIGEYSKQKKITNNAFEFMKYILGK